MVSEIVDFKSLSLESNVEKRGELARQVALLFSKTWERCSEEQIDIYDDVMMRLSEMVEVQARVYMSECLSSLRRAPEETVRQLAKDEIEVAAPILRKSTVLREQDLLEIAGALSDAHRMAIAEREIISEPVSEVLVEKGDKPVRLQVAANDGAMLNERVVEKLMQDAREDETMQYSLGARGDLADEQIEELIGFASEQVRLRLLETGRSDDAARLPHAARFAAQKLSNDYWLARYDFETAAGRVLGLARDGKLNETVLRRFAEEERFAEAAACFALLAGVGYEEAKHWMVRNDTTPFISVCRAIDLNLMTLQALLKIGPWRYRLTAKDRQQAISSFQKMDLSKARKVLQQWKEGWSD